MQKEIFDAYKEYGYPSVKKLYKILDGKFKVEDIQKIVEKEPVHQLYYNKRNKPGHIITSRPNEEWFADLCFMDKFGGVNKGYHYILLIIDAYSRFAFAYPLKSKNIGEVVDAFRTIIDKGNKPDLLCSDNGSEFIGRAFKNLLEENDIIGQTVEVGDHHALGLIDRLTKTIKNIIYKNFVASNNNIWIDKLDYIIEKYNNTPNEGILNYKPDDIYKGDEGKQAILNYYNFKRSGNNNENKFQEGEDVRIKIPDTKFRRGFHPKWSEDLHKIDKVDGRKVIIDGKKYKVVNIIKGSGNVGNELKKGLKEDRVKRALNKEGIVINDEPQNERQAEKINFDASLVGRIVKRKGIEGEIVKYDETGPYHWGIKWNGGTRESEFFNKKEIVLYLVRK